VDTVGKDFLVLVQRITKVRRKRERIDEIMRIGRTAEMFDDEGVELLEHVCQGVNDLTGWEISAWGEGRVFTHDPLWELQRTIDNLKRGWNGTDCKEME